MKQPFGKADNVVIVATMSLNPKLTAAASHDALS
jgi:hypothetical protein